MSTDYGFDISCVSDTGLVDVVVTSPALVIGQRIARRLQTPRGGLAAVDPGAADFGWDVRQYLNGKLSPALISLAQQQIKAECEKEAEVQSADVTLTFVNGGALTIKISLTSAAGPFTLVLNVSQVTYQALVSS